MIIVRPIPLDRCKERSQFLRDNDRRSRMLMAFCAQVLRLQRQLKCSQSDPVILSRWQMQFSLSISPDTQTERVRRAHKPIANFAWIKAQIHSNVLLMTPQKLTLADEMCDSHVSWFSHYHEPSWSRLLLLRRLDHSEDCLYKSKTIVTSWNVSHSFKWWYFSQREFASFGAKVNIVVGLKLFEWLVSGKSRSRPQDIQTGESLFVIVVVHFDKQPAQEKAVTFHLCERQSFASKHNSLRM